MPELDKFKSQNGGKPDCGIGTPRQVRWQPLWARHPHRPNRANAVGSTHGAIGM